METVNCAKCNTSVTHLVVADLASVALESAEAVVAAVPPASLVGPACLEEVAFPAAC